jgi:hypothetical protein
VQHHVYDHAILRQSRIHELIERVKRTERNGRRLLAGTSYGGGFVPLENVVRVSDFLLIHGNGVSNPDRIVEMAQQTRKVAGYRPMPSSSTRTITLISTSRGTTSRPRSARM